MKKFGAFLIGVCAATSLTFAETVKEINTKTRSLEKVKSEIVERQQEKEKLEKESADLSQSIKDSEYKLRTLENSLLYTKQKTIDIEQKLAQTKNENDRVITGVTQQRQDLSSQLHAIQVASILQSPQSPSAVAGRIIAHSQAATLRQTLQKRDETDANLRELVDSQEIVRREYQKQQDSLSATKQGRESKERLLTKKKTRQEVLEGELKDLQRTAEELASLIDGLRSQAKEEKESEREARKQKQLTGQSPIGAHSLPWPLHGKMAIHFGRQQHPTLNTTFISNGIVITTPEVQPLQTVADGKVLYAGQFMSYGSMVVIEHPGDWYSVYGYLSNWIVEKGQDVKRGDTIGEARPRAGGYEGYFELRFYGKSVDPVPWLN